MNIANITRSTFPEVECIKLKKLFGTLISRMHSHSGEWERGVLILFVPFFLIGCGDMPKESKPIEQPKQVVVEKKSTYTTPKFHQNGELYQKSNKPSIVQPYKILTAKGNVKDILVDSTTLYAATDNGAVEIFDLTSYEQIDTIAIPKFHDDIYDQEVTPTVYSIDKIGDKIIILTSYKGVQKRLYLYENRVLNEITGLDPNLMMIKVRFVNERSILVGLLSNELIRYDINENKPIYRTKLSESSFADMALSVDKSQAVVGCESGIVYLVDVPSGELKSVIQGANKDKSYKVDIKQNWVLSAGQDSIGAIYNLQTNTFKTVEASFLIYAGALSSDGSRAAFAYNEENELLVVDATDSTKAAYLLSGQKSTLNAIRFLDNQNLISASDDEFIMVWKLP